MLQHNKQCRALVSNGAVAKVRGCSSITNAFGYWSEHMGRMTVISRSSAGDEKAWGADSGALLPSVG